jgi:SAM-dependent methyltransferase
MSTTAEQSSSPRPAPRYDGLADWYESFNAPIAEANRDLIVDLLGPGSGPCLDLGCGTGLHFAALREAGRVPVGVDLSADLPAFARTRGTFALRLHRPAASMPASPSPLT